MSVADAANAAAKWWATRLRDGAGVADSGSGEPRDAMNMAIARNLRSLHPMTDEICERFERLLAAGIVGMIETEPGTLGRDLSGFDDGGPRVTLRVDYQPDEVLFRALDESGAIDSGQDISVHLSTMLRPPLPRKTTMTVSARRVLVSHGYGAPWVEIWGPAWGATYEEQRRADAYRRDAEAPDFEAWTKACPRWELRDWVGCVPEERKT